MRWLIQTIAMFHRWGERFGVRLFRRWDNGTMDGRWLLCLLLVLSGVLTIPSKGRAETTLQSAAQGFDESDEFFESKVRPILVQSCYECHSSDALKVQAGLYLDSREGVLQGGDSGNAIVPGKPEESLLISAIRYEGLEMPPDRKLSLREVEILTQWIRNGAPWPTTPSEPSSGLSGSKKEWSKFDWNAARQEHWAWKPIERPSLPKESEVGAISNVSGIDRWVTTKRWTLGLPTSPPAKFSLLARRIYLDLLGIPPTIDQLREFEQAAAQDRQEAISRLIDHLLDSPLYGQRWGRYWLDVARYSDGRGGFLEGDKPLNDAWRYRDWVVDAIQRDLPIDTFFRLQIAGDLTGDPANAVATGFFALGPVYQSDGGDPDSIAQSKAETLEDRIDVLARGMLGLTATCARCHDHKFDPIPQQDYYSLAGIFQNSASHELPLAKSELVEQFRAHKAKVDELTKKIKGFKKKPKKANQEEPTQPKEEVFEDAIRSEQEWEKWKEELTELEKHAPPPLETAHALHDIGSENMKVAVRGNLLKTGEEAPRRFLRILAGSDPIAYQRGSGREELAASVIDPRNPLTARVFVNRVWQHHFGAGLVRTPSNFGILGEKPTHPELLDWLASEFMDDGWSLKKLHRKIMNSSTYQLGSDYIEQAYREDGDNRYLWRMSPRRMEVEAWRDSLLAVTGELDASRGGTPVPDIVRSNRRTLYAKVARNGDVFESDAFLRLFDFPLMRSTVEQRPVSIVPQQFLFLLNSEFMMDRAKALSARLHSEEDSDEARIRRAYRMLYARDAAPHELEVGLQFLRHQHPEGSLSPWVRYAHALLSSNEFMFVR